MFFFLKLLSLFLFAEAPVPVESNLDRIELSIVKKNFSEAIQQLKDIPRADRGSRYTNLLEKAAIGSIQSETSLATAEGLGESLIKVFPALAKSENYQKERDQITKDGFIKCYQDSKETEECSLRLYAKIEKDPSRTSLLLWAASQLQVNHKAELAYQAMGLGVATKGKKQICESKNLIELSLPFLIKGEPYNEKFINVLKKDCWKEIRGKLAKEIATQKEDTFLKNACRLFKEMKTPHAKCK